MTKSFSVGFVKERRTFVGTFFEPPDVCTFAPKMQLCSLHLAPYVSSPCCARALCLCSSPSGMVSSGSRSRSAWLVYRALVLALGLVTGGSVAGDDDGGAAAAAGAGGMAILEKKPSTGVCEGGRV